MVPSARLYVLVEDVMNTDSVKYRKNDVNKCQI